MKIAVVKLMNKILKWCKGQPVLIISLLAAIVSVFLVPPDEKYLEYCNRSVLILLFCLMVTVAGFRSIGVFEVITGLLLKKAGSIRRLGILLVTICFFVSMLVTNDVALLTFVPLTLMLFRRIDDSKSLIFVIVLETVAANLGSMLTPIGNPQNLYIYEKYSLDPLHFISLMLPLGILSYIIIFALSFFLPHKECSASVGEARHIPALKTTAYIITFIVCLCSVLKIVPDWLCLLICIVIIAVSDYKLFAKADYALLATFVCFFVFVGNISRVELVRDFFAAFMQGRELVTSALLSQCISNVPAAVMLSGFTNNADALLLGVNIGGLGTPIASLASLISYQFYSRSEGARSKKYLLVFSAVNFGMLILLLLFAGFVQPIFYRL